MSWIIGKKLDLIIKLLEELKVMSSTVSANLLALQAQVAQNTSVEASAVTLIQGLAAQIAAAVNSGDDAALPALTASLNASATALAAAITANTPAAPPAATGTT